MGETKEVIKYIGKYNKVTCNIFFGISINSIPYPNQNPLFFFLSVNKPKFMGIRKTCSNMAPIESFTENGL